MNGTLAVQRPARGNPAGDPLRLLTLARRLSERGVKRYAVQLVRTEQMFDPLLPSLSVHGAALPELWQALRELFPVFVLRG